VLLKIKPYLTCFGKIAGIACDLKLTFESLSKESQVIAEKDLIKRKDDKEKELALLQEALEFEQRHRKPKTS